MAAEVKTSTDVKPTRATSVLSRQDGCGSCRKEFQDKLRAWRRILRGFYLSVLLLGFVLGIYFLFMTIPNMSVHRVYLEHGGQRDYASRHLYNEHIPYGINVDMEKQKNEATLRSLYNQFGLRIITNESASSAGADKRKSLTCPCTRTMFDWNDYTHFYFLTYSRPNRKPYMKYLFPPELEGRLGSIVIDASGFDSQYLTRTPTRLNSYLDFCNLLNNLPSDLLIVQSQFMDCQDLVTPLLSNSVSDRVQSRWKDSRSSSFESPVLLQQELLYSRTLDLLRSYLREKHALIQSTSTIFGENSTNRDMFLTGLTDIWVHVLDTFAGNSSCSDRDFFTAAATRTCKDFAEQVSYYPYHFAVMLDQGQTFLGMSMNWTEYYNVCQPSYCDVMETRGKFLRACTAIALLGGLGTCILLLAHLVIWPLSDAALIYFCSRRRGGNRSPNPPLQAANLQRTSTARLQRIDRGIETP